MRLIEQIKRLREEFPQIKIRQKADSLNRTFAIFELDSCAENIRLYFEHDYIILEFYDCRSVYGYPENEFRYLVEELHSLIECRTLVMSISDGELTYGGFMVSAESLSGADISAAARRLCRKNFSGELPEKIFVNLRYCNTELDSCEYCDFRKKL